MTNFEKLTKTKKALATFLSGITIKHGCINCPANVRGCNAKSCEQKWENWLGDIGLRLGLTNFEALTTCPEELADFIAYELTIVDECSICPARNCSDVGCWNNITDWLEREVEK